MSSSDNLTIVENGLTILIAEDHKLIRKISRQILSDLYPAAIFFETDSIEGFIDLCKKQKFNLMLLDVHLTDGNTLTVLSTAKTLQPAAGILYFTMCPEDIFGKRILNNGADGFLNKRADESELREAVTTILSGEKYISRPLQRQMVQEAITRTESNPFDRLSDREFEVMILLLQGKSLAEIGCEMSIQVSTVGTHKTRLFDKLSISSLVELTKISAAYNIVS